MKISKKDFAELESAVNAALEELGGAEFADKYRRGEFPRADRTKDVNKRFRWDLLYSVPLDTRDPIVRRLYDSGCNDSHIDTALRQIVRPL